MAQQRLFQPTSSQPPQPHPPHPAGIPTHRPISRSNSGSSKDAGGQARLPLPASMPRPPALGQAGGGPSSSGPVSGSGVGMLGASPRAHTLTIMSGSFSSVESEPATSPGAGAISPNGAGGVGLGSMREAGSGGASVSKLAVRAKGKLSGSPRSVSGSGSPGAAGSGSGMFSREGEGGRAGAGAGAGEQTQQRGRMHVQGARAGVEVLVGRQAGRHTALHASKVRGHHIRNCN